MLNDRIPPAPSGLDHGETTHGTPRDARRDAIIAKFANWLDAVLEDEHPPEGIAAELLSVIEDKPLDESPEACAEYEVWSSLTSLAHDVKLQGRAFRDLTEAVSPLQESLDTLAKRDAQVNIVPLREAIAALEASREDIERTVGAAASDAAWREIIDLLLELRDRLCRGCEGLQATVAQLRKTHGRRRLPQWLPGVRHTVDQVFESVSALEQGNALILERLDESLTRIGIHEIPAENRPFDSTTMKVVEVETRDDLPDGTVSAIHRSGYTWRGEIYRLAEVKVARRATTTSSGENNT